ncbi:leucine-rich repeat receptor-like serine/threonine-protein kinase At2g14510 [Triticum dicoccoides]|uniref:leucine-rich repeat receptor-like serine/threonine-protein kinase At2g14510 n=1 Tax=Triticum dicoccoides TaxID=85692 RepID=UPI00188F9084|nr:leucine-rich repeat receptor-like serine/threonine-protein kinase At2g14510 [Triticum dicoccoides]
MEAPPPRSRDMTARWLFLFLLGVAGSAVLQVHGQADSLGFISIDCGLPGKTGYIDSTTKLSYATDAGFTNTGTNHNISAEYVTPTTGKIWRSVRSFPDGLRNCYTLRSLVPGLKYLIRALFKHGNYDGRLNRWPIFDIHIGVNYWQTVNITDGDMPVIAEIITVISGDSVQVCLVNTGSGTPFISSLELRPLKNKLYPQSDMSQALVLATRANVGASANLRYPDDPHDRIWISLNVPSWMAISTTKEVQNSVIDFFEVPSTVTQTGVTSINSSTPIIFFWDVTSAKDSMPGYVFMLYMAELQHLPSNALRQFYVKLNDKPWDTKPRGLKYLETTVLYNEKPDYASQQYIFSLEATTNSTLPPILNALEIFSVVPTTGLATTTHEISAMTTIRDMYQMKKNWMGDPCAPKNFAWNGLHCGYAVSRPPTITGLNLSSSGLSGNISSSFASLKGLQYLDLSGNNLMGSIPDTLSQLSSLTLLDLTGNQLTGSIPSGLLKRTQDDSLTLRYGNNPNLCSNGNSCQPPKKKPRSMVVVHIVVPIFVVLIIVLLSILLLCMRKRRQGTTTNSVRPQNESIDNYGHTSLRLESRRFTYSELEVITNGFQRVVGRGGFGKVYDGFLEDGTQVAVKLRSESSNQGVQEFLAEAQSLAKIHHKNLVSMFGYCKEREYMALVYEYMSEGALDEHLRGKDNNTRTLSWRQRLLIALESAQGLEYLHKGCNPPLIHRDVKTSNILLNTNLEAKIADFGLLKAFNNDSDTHVSTARVVGTPGYVDPEYYATFQLTSKSDVFSFGVVLLEIVTGQPPIPNDPEPTSIIQWARQRLARGNIEAVVDIHMHGDHDVNSVWRVADTALKCTAQAPEQRPTMTDVVALLHECLELEDARNHMNARFYTAGSDTNLNNYSQYDTGMSTDVSQSRTALEAEHFDRVPRMSDGPAVR